MLTLILGPSGSGKSVRLREELRQRARSRQRSILIVPEQFTSSTEGALYHALGDELSAYVESYSFTSLAETLLRRYGGAAVPTLSEAGRAVLVRRAMDEMMDKVVYYSRQRRSAHHCTMGSKFERWLLTNRYSVSVGTFSSPVTWIFTRQSARIQPSSAIVSA